MKSLFEKAREQTEFQRLMTASIGGLGTLLLWASLSSLKGEVAKFATYGFGFLIFQLICLGIYEQIIGKTNKP